MSHTGKIVLGVVAGVLVLCICLSVACTAAAAFIFINRSSIQNSSPLPLDISTPEPGIPQQDSQESPDDIQPLVPLPEPVDPTPEGDDLGSANTPGESSPPDAAAEETLQTLESEIVPINDAVDLAERLKGLTGIPDSVPPPARPYKVGDSKTFWVTNNDSADNRELTASLQYANDVVVFWIEKGVPFNSRDLRELADTFAEKIYPTNRQFFGSERSPGIDGDPRLYVLYARGLGESVAGYFSSADAIHPDAFAYSNAHEMFVLSADNVTLGEPYVFGTMAHEFQHMIHFALDRNEEGWLNEGFSMLAELLNGYESGGFEELYASDPDMQLTTWVSMDSAFTSAQHYGASFLFTAYFLSRFNDEATQALVADSANGMDSVDDVLRKLGLNNEQGEQLTADEVFADWTVANYLYDGSVPGERFNYRVYPDAPKAGPTESFTRCPVDRQDRNVYQYGADYIQLTCPGSYTLNFEGATEVSLLPEEAYSGEYAFWSNQGDESDMTLTQEFDFEGVSGPIHLSYRTWYDIEQDFDYVYVLASLDGKRWDILKTPSGTDYNPGGANYGWGYTGESEGWIEETVDLSGYAGEKVQLRFEYITDTALNGRGMLIDDIRLDAANYFSDLETDEGGWQGDGFVRVSSTLPQTFQVSLIRFGAETTVEKLALDELQRGSAEINIGSEVEEVVVVVSGTTRFTTQPARYRFSVR